MASEIAVQCGKLPAWLLTRRLIPEDYPKLLAATQVRISEARQEAISDEAASGLISEHGENVHYLAAKQIYEAVVQTPEGQAKSLLGGHTHSGAAKWKAVLDAYQRRHLGWASAARLLIQNVNYEIPALKKHAASCERQVSDCTAREAELDRQEASARTRYRELLAEMGIEGFDIRKELRAHSAQELPKLALEICTLLREVGEDLHRYYRSFAAHVAGRPFESGEVLPFLLAVSTSGELPSLEALEAEVPAFRTARADAASKANATAAMNVEDLGITAEKEGTTETGSGGINWDIEATEAPQPTDAVETGAEGGIDWGAVSFEGLEVSVEAPDDSAPVGGELLTDSAARELLTRDVAEAAAFLAERTSDLSAGGAASEEYGPRDEQRSLREVEAFRTSVNRVEAILAARRTQRLVLLSTSQRYLERTARRVQVAKQQCGKPGQRKLELAKVKAEQLAEAKRTRAEIEKLRDVTLAVKGDLEAELSAHLKSAVRIVGEIAQI